MSKRMKKGLPTRLRELNQIYFVTNVDGTTWLVSEVMNPDTKLRVLQFSKEQDFRALFANEYYDALNPKTGRIAPQSLGQIWWEWPGRRQLPGIVFAPGDPKITEDGYYNSWMGFAVEPKEGDWSLLKSHGQEIICDGNRKHFTYFMDWMAHAVQKPKIMPGVAVILSGGEGTGKGTFVDAFGKLFGPHYYKASNPRQITGQFTGHLRDKLVLFADEAVAASDDQAISVLKSMITEEDLGLEAKYREAGMKHSHIHLIMASNNAWMVNAGADARRLFVLEVSEKRKRDKDYFRAILEQLDHGGREAMLYELLHRDIEAFVPQDCPMTDALMDQKFHTLHNDVYAKWWYHCLREGRINLTYPFPERGPIVVPVSAIRASYEIYSGLECPPGPTFNKAITLFLPDWTLKTSRKAEQNRSWELPDLAKARQLFARWLGHDVEKVFDLLNDSEDEGLEPGTTTEEVLTHVLL